jgi:hypothetical protein
MYCPLFDFKNRIGWNEGFLIFRTPAESGISSLEVPQTALREKSENLEKARQELEKKVKDYNEKYSSGYAKWEKESEEEKKRNPHEQPLALDLRNPAQLEAQIKGIQNSTIFFETSEYPFAEIVGRFSNRESQADDLQAILNTVTQLQALDFQKVEAKAELAGAAETRFTERGAGLRDLLAEKKHLSVGPGFDNVEGLLNMAIKNPLLKDRRFESLWTGPNGKEDQQQLRQNMDMFLSILASQTNNFAPGQFILGNDFQNDPVANKRNHPFLFEEWKRYGNVEDPTVEDRAAKVGGLESEYGVKTMQVPDEANAVLVAQNLPNQFRVQAKLKPEGTNTREDFKALADDLDGVRKKLVVYKRDSLKNQPDKIAAAEKAITALERYAKLIEANADYQTRVEEQAENGNAFTRSSLEKKPQLVLEMALRQYQKAVAIVDRTSGPLGASTQNLMNPSVRNMIIATVYQQGVSRYSFKDGKESYEDNVDDEYSVMLPKLALSPYFNRLNLGHFLDAEQRDFLIFARYANLAFSKENFLTDKVGAMKTLAPKVADYASKTDAEKAEIDKDIAALARWIPGIDAKTPLSRDNLAQVLAREEGELQSWIDFRGEAEGLMNRKPADGQSDEDFKGQMRKDLREFMDRFKAKTAYDPIYGSSNKAIIESYSTQIQKIDNTYQTLSFDEKSRSAALERMGMRLEGFYAGFEKYRADHPEMSLEKWDSYLLASGDVEKLITMFQVILPESSVAGGKEDFLAVLRTLHGNFPDKITPENRDAHSLALAVYGVLKQEIKDRETVSDKTAKDHAEVQSRVNGMTFGDKVTEYSRSVIDMLIGPGQTIANRAAGAAILFAAYKLIMKGVKGDDKWGKLLRVGGLAVAAELVLKHVTGEGMLDRARLTGVAAALEGSYESVLLERGKNLDISSDEHSRALLEMNKVPFKSLMEWYNNSTEGGQPFTGKKDIFPREINTYAIARGIGLKEQDSGMRARYVVKKAMQNFMGYVGNKDRMGEDHGREALQERWITAVEHPEFDLSKMKGTDIELSKVLIQGYRKNPRGLTWQEVMKAEIDPDDVKKTAKGGIMNQIIEWSQEKANIAIANLRTEIVSPTDEKLKVIYARMGDRYAPWLKEKLSKAIKTGKEKIEVAEDSVSIWYNENEATIIRFAEGHWELVKAGVRVPLEVLYGLDQAVVPWTNAKVRQLEDIVGGPQFFTENADLSLGDFVGAGLLANGQLNKQKFDNPEVLYSQKDNEKFDRLGYYTIPFVKAFQAAGNNPERVAKGEAYFEDKNPTPENRGMTAAYMITSIDRKEANVLTDNKDSALSLMKTAIKEKAIRQFMAKNPKMKKEMLETYMDTIHVVIQKSQEGETPNKIYAFWRMPMPEGMEYFLKETHHFPDYEDAARIKDRPPFIVDPDKTLFDNLKGAFGINDYGTLKYAGYLQVALAEWIRVSNFVVSRTGDLAAFGAEFIPRHGPHIAKEIEKFTRLDEEQLEWLDEHLESAGSGHPISALYQNDKNKQKEYKIALAVARLNHEHMYLKNIPGRKNPKDYEDQPKDWARKHADAVARLKKDGEIE